MFVTFLLSFSLILRNCSVCVTTPLFHEWVKNDARNGEYLQTFELTSWPCTVGSAEDPREHTDWYIPVLPTATSSGLVTFLKYIKMQMEDLKNNKPWGHFSFGDDLRRPSLTHTPPPGPPATLSLGALLQMIREDATVRS